MLLSKLAGISLATMVLAPSQVLGQTFSSGNINSDLDEGTNRYEIEVDMVDGCDVVCDVDLTVDIDTRLSWETTGATQTDEVMIRLKYDGMVSSSALVFDQECGNQQEIELHFDNDGSTPVDGLGDCTSTDDIIPAESFDTFNNMMATGTWVLEIELETTGSWSVNNDGVLENWSLDITPCTACGGGGTGDPHMQTWAGEWYDFHGLCDLVLLSTPDFSDNAGLDIHIRTKGRGDYSYIETAAIRIGEDIFEVGSFAEYWINGVEDVRLPYMMGGKYELTHKQISKKINEFYIQLEHGDVVFIRVNKDMVSVKIDHGSFDTFEKSVGLMGKFGTGEWLARNGTAMPNDDANGYGQEWQVRGTEDKLFQAVRQPQYPLQCVMPSTKKESRRLGESINREAAEKACAHWGEQMDQCIYDVMAMGDLELAQAGAF